MSDPIVVAMELPTPDVVIVTSDEQPALVLADPRVPPRFLADTLANLRSITAGRPRPLAAV